MADRRRERRLAIREWGSREGIHALNLLAFALLVGGYWIVRSGGHWADNDSSFMANAIRSVVSEGRLAPNATEVYANGYGYQVVSAVVLAFTGLDVATLQQYVYPLISALVVVSAWVAYRELLGDNRTATVATLLLFLVPGFLFSILRGSHERLDRVFIFVMLWLIARAVRGRHTQQTHAVYAGLIVLTTYALVATNDLFAISMLAAIGAALAGAWILQWKPFRVGVVVGDIVRQLRWVTAAGVATLAVFMLFIYEPAGHSLRQLLEIPNGILTALFAEAPGGGPTPGTPGPGGGDPYAGVATRWVSPAAYVLLSSGEYLLIGVSAMAWLHQGWRFVRRPETRTFGISLLWLLYGAFAVQMVAAVLSDQSGAVANNLQYRSFTILAVIAAPIVAHWLVGMGALGWPKPMLRIGLGLLVIAALLKSTNEPAVSNSWTFYTPAELSALEWADSHQRDTITWVGIDDRLSSAYGVSVGAPQNQNKWAFTEPGPIVRGFLISDVVRLQTARSGVPLPALGPHNLVYDNGSAQLYRTRATAPFER